MRGIKEQCFNLLTGFINAYVIYQLAEKYPDWTFVIAFLGGAITIAIMDLINPYNIKNNH